MRVPVKNLKRKITVSFLNIATTATVGITVLLGIVNSKLPDVTTLTSTELKMPLTVYDRNGEPLATYGDERREPLDYDKIPDQLKQTLYSAADPDFEVAETSSLAGLFNSETILNEQGEIITKGPGLTQIVVNKYFENLEQVEDGKWTDNFLNKLRSVLLSFKINNTSTKEEIVTLLVNKISLGNKAYGFEAGAKTYFGKSVGELSYAQLATLVASSLDPQNADPYRFPDTSLQHRNAILHALKNNGYISDADLMTALSEEMVLDNAYKDYVQTYATDIAYNAIIKKFGEPAKNQGLNVYLTITKAEQDYAQMQLRAQLVDSERSSSFRGRISSLWTDSAPDDKTIIKELSKIPVYAPLFPVVIKSVTDEKVVVMNAWGTTQEIPAAQLQWALTYVPNRQGSSAPVDTSSNTVEAERVLSALNDKKDTASETTTTPSTITGETTPNDMPTAPGVVASYAPGSVLSSFNNPEEVSKRAAEEEKKAAEEAEKSRLAAEKRLQEQAKLRATATLNKVFRPGDVIYLMVKPTSSEFANAMALTDLKGGFDPFVKVPITELDLAQIPRAAGAYVSLDSNTGAVTSVVGGFDVRLNELNRALEQEQYIGGLVNPFVYSYVLTKGQTLASFEYDQPISVPLTEDKTWSPVNNSGVYSKQLYTLRRALAENLNTVPVTALARASNSRLADFFDYFQHFAIRQVDLEGSLYFAGQVKLSPLTLARAYATFNNGGFIINPYIIQRIAIGDQTYYEASNPKACTNCDAVNIFATQQSSNLSVGQDSTVHAAFNASIEDLDTGNSQSAIAPRVVNEGQAFLINDVLNFAVQKAGNATKLRELGRSDVSAIAATNIDHTAGWLAGYLGVQTVVSYIAPNDPDVKPTVTELINNNFPLWININKRNLANYSVYRPAVSSELVSRRINPNNGALDSNGYLEYFVAGTEPQQAAYEIQVVETTTTTTTKGAATTGGEQYRTETRTVQRKLTDEEVKKLREEQEKERNKNKSPEQIQKEKEEAEKARKEEEKRKKQYKPDGTFNDDEFNFYGED